MASSTAASNLYIYPLICGILFPATFAITYTIGTSLGHIKTFFSYISDTGAYSPESCIFSLLMCLSALSMEVVVYIRYKQVEEYFRDTELVWKKRINKTGLVLGTISALGAAIVGCFQEVNIYPMHFTGAALAFFGGGIYLLVEAYFTFKMLPLFASHVLGWIRVFLGVMCLVLFVATFGAGTVSLRQYTGDDPTRWDKNLGGWSLHIVSTVSEWVMAAFFDIYILSFIPEFRKISMEAPKFTLVELATVSSNNNKTEKVIMHRVDQGRTSEDNDTSV